MTYPEHLELKALEHAAAAADLLQLAASVWDRRSKAGDPAATEARELCASVAANMRGEGTELRDAIADRAVPGI